MKTESPSYRFAFEALPGRPRIRRSALAAARALAASPLDHRHPDMRNERRLVDEIKGLLRHERDRWGDEAAALDELRCQIRLAPDLADAIDQADQTLLWRRREKQRRLDFGSALMVPFAVVLSPIMLPVWAFNAVMNRKTGKQRAAEAQALATTRDEARAIIAATSPQEAMALILAGIWTDPDEDADIAEHPSFSGPAPRHGSGVSPA